MGKSVNKNFNIIIVFLCAILSATSLCFSYIFGSEFQNTKFYSTLMSVDAKVKKQSDNHFLHGMIDWDKESDNFSFADEYYKYLNLQRRTKTFYSYYNSLLVSSITDDNNNTEFLEYNVDFSINENTKYVSNLVQVSTYYDVDFMESIGLPLFNNYDDEDPVKIKPIRIDSRTGKQKQYGAYISASQAEEIVRNNGMFEEALALTEGDEQKALISAFRTLLSKDTYDLQKPDNLNIFYIQNPNIEDGNKIVCTINNIYLDSEHVYMLNDFQIMVGTRRYNDYFVTFEKHFKDSIFTFAPYIFNKGSSYYFDIRKNYGNLDRFFNEVTGFNYAKEDLRVELYAEDGSILEESAVLNDASLYSENNLKYLWLVFALIFISFIIALRDIFDKSISNKFKLIIAASPLGVFAILQLIFYLSLDFGFKKFMLYNCFNPMGNIVFLLCILAVIINEIIWRVYVKKS